MPRTKIDNYMDPEDTNRLVVEAEADATSSTGRIDLELQQKLVEEAFYELIDQAGDIEAIARTWAHDAAVSKVQGRRGGKKLKFRSGVPQFKPDSRITVDDNIDVLCTHATMEDWLAVIAIDQSNIARQMAASAQKTLFVQTLPPLYKQHKTMNKIIQMEFGFIDENDDSDEDVA